MYLRQSLLDDLVYFLEGRATLAHLRHTHKAYPAFETPPSSAKAQGCARWAFDKVKRGPDQTSEMAENGAILPFSDALPDAEYFSKFGARIGLRLDLMSQSNCRKTWHFCFFFSDDRRRDFIYELASPVIM